MNYKVSWLLCALTIVVGCGGGSDSDGGSDGTDNTPAITETACTSSDGDTVKVEPVGDRETDFIHSHLVGSPTYGELVTRDKADGTTEVTMDYMVHTPEGTPSGLLVLVAGGSLDAGIEGSDAGVTRSRGNFLVRSAHRFMQKGYVAVTIDRPSDYQDYGDVDSQSYLIDAYLNSMDHAVDLATVINEVNTDNLPVIIAGTSRGAISAAANNTLAAGIALSSPKTRDRNGGSPIGSSSLPVSTIERPVHLLIHSDDACTGTSPANSRALFEEIESNGIDIEGDAVTGGFRDTVRDDVCGARDYHGFTGIETCAVSKETAWMDSLTSSLASNTQPQARSESSYVGVTQVDLGTLVSDADGDTLSYSLPYGESALGGTISVNSSTGIVSYSAPPGLLPGTQDSFAYVVTDGNGGVATAVVRISSP